MVSKRIRKARGIDLFEGFNIAIMLLLIFVTLYPFWYVLVSSFSTIGHIISGGFIFWPDGLHFEAYQQVFRNDLIQTAYRNTIVVTVAGTCISMALTILGAYVLSLKDMPGHTAMTLFTVVTMMFSGGLIPTYLVVNGLGLVDTLWALMLPSAISTYNMVLMRNFFQSIPSELHEAAELDGLGHGRYLTRIVVPLSLPSIATITLFYMVGYWNAYFAGIIYIRTRELLPMQTVLRNVLMTAQFSTYMYDDMTQTLASETLKYAMIIVTVTPIICVYPFVQKYFVKGILTGSLKG